MVRSKKHSFIPAIKTNHTIPAQKTHRMLCYNYIQTPIGSLYVIADSQALYLLQFADQANLDRLIYKCQNTFKATLVLKTNQTIESIKQELHDYFQGKLYEFKTPLKLYGTPFQQISWLSLQQIPYGATQSYSQLARNLNKPKAQRAIAQINKANKCIIIVPCHRVIYQNGKLGGYAGRVDRKEWLLNHEQTHKKSI